MTLGIVILNYNTPDLTVACLRSVLDDVAEINVQIVIVDNGSTDGSPQKLAAAIVGVKSVELLSLQNNVGFATGNNRGIERVSATDYVLLLNSDTIVHRGCLQKCLDVMQSDATIGVMSCQLQNADGSVQNVARRFLTPFRALACTFGLPWRLPCLFAFADPEDPNWDRRTCKRDVDWLGGAFFFLCGSAIKTCGKLDEDFFFYGEDVEYCHRLRKHGYRCHYDPSTIVTHLGGASNSTGKNELRMKARHLIQRKCYGRFAEVIVRTADKFRSLFR